MSRWNALIAAGVIVCGNVIMADQVSAQYDDARFSRFLIGGAFNWVHHTGYVPYSPTQADTAEYTIGGKVFGGVRFDPSLQFEVAYHYLGEVAVEGLPVPTQARSYAISGSLVYVSPALSDWFGEHYKSVHLLLRLGLAYKHVTQVSALETLQEGFLSGVLGAALEYRFTQHVFARLEYEFISSAIGGPKQEAPAINSLFKASFGGTNRVINVMNTPLALTLGFNF